MIKATMNGPNGKVAKLVIGLSHLNLERLREDPDGYIQIVGKEMNLPFDILIFSGKNEAEMARILPVGPDTKVHVSDRLKN